MGFWASLVIFLIFSPAISGQQIENAVPEIDNAVPIFSPNILGRKIQNAVLEINTAETVASTDDNFVCATIDWWPQDKCNYNQCPWGLSSLLNLDLNHPLLSKAVQAFKNLRIRIGGSLQDQVHYHGQNSTSPCAPFRKDAGDLFGFSKGCLDMQRWDELNNFFKKTGAVVTFGLNALYGKHKNNGGAWVGDWDSSNALSFINYTISKGYQIDSWEFGNELSGKGIGASVGAEQYAKDVIHLNSLMNELYHNEQHKPLVLAPGGFYDKEWFAKFLQVSGPGVVDVVTHHIYNLGAGNDDKLVNKILNPQHLSKVTDTFGNLSLTIQSNGPWASAWVGEAGGAYNSGGRNVSNTFVDSFWYLDQLGMSAKYNTKVYCRQTLIGGNYGLLDTTTFEPNPDYYSALLWHQLMGKVVLSVNSSDPYLRSYAHCSKGRAGVTLLLINLSSLREFRVDIQSTTENLFKKAKAKKNSFVHGIKKTVSWVGSKASDAPLSREEYHLTPRGGNIRSRNMMLNGSPLQLSDAGDAPKFGPSLVNLKSPISIPPLSIKFIAFPNLNAPGCR